MSALLFHANAPGTCAHGGVVRVQPQQGRVWVAGERVATVADLVSVSGCPFQLATPAGPKPQPCVSVPFTAATRVLASGQPVLLRSGSLQGRSAEQVPQGPASVLGQTRVRAV